MKKGILIMSVAIMAAATSCGTKSAGEKVQAIDLAIWTLLFPQKKIFISMRQAVGRKTIR